MDFDSSSISFYPGGFLGYPFFQLIPQGTFSKKKRL